MTKDFKYKHNTGRFVTKDGLQLFEQHWIPENEIKAVIVIVHSYLEHSSRYCYFAEKLVENGFAAATYDLRGHGHSEGIKAFVWTFDEYEDDLDTFIKRIYDYYPGKKIFLAGHSMGGTIAAFFSLRPYLYNIKGLILTSPAVEKGDGFSIIMVVISTFIGKFFPIMSTIKTESSFISRDLSVVENYEKDPLVYHKGAPAKTAYEIQNATKKIQKKINEISMPFFILHGGENRIVDVKGSIKFYEMAKSKDKKLKIYERLYHEILNEPEKNEVINDIIEWINNRI